MMLLLLLLVSLGVHVCPITGTQSCQHGASNYTYSQTYERTTQIRVKKSRITMYQDCWVVLPWVCSTETKTVDYVETETHTFEETEMETACCPGYVMENDTCVNGCPEGFYGVNCTHNCSCPENALDHCDQHTGYCTCIEGKTGHLCNESCADGFYGPNCSHECTCEHNSSCDILTGACNCTASPGWTGISCRQACINSTFGTDCAEACSCNENQTCHHVTGQCTCKPGNGGQDCTDECSAGTWGINCTGDCTCDPRTTDTCNRSTGACQCKPGYEGPNCSEDCAMGYYGESCARNCSDHCNGTRYCDPVNATCMCFGSRGENCSEDCEEGMFGWECTQHCNCNQSNTVNGSCNQYNGTCDCLSGWMGSTCDISALVSTEETVTKKVVSEEEADAAMRQEFYMYIGGGAGTVVLVVCAVCIACCLGNRRKKRLKNGKKRESDINSIVENPDYISADVCKGIAAEQNNSIPLTTVSDGTVSEQDRTTNDKDVKNGSPRITNATATIINNSVEIVNEQSNVRHTALANGDVTNRDSDIDNYTLPDTVDDTVTDGEDIYDTADKDDDVKVVDEEELYDTADNYERNSCTKSVVLHSKAVPAAGEEDVYDTTCVGSHRATLRREQSNPNTGNVYDTFENVKEKGKTREVKSRMSITPRNSHNDELYDSTMATKSFDKQQSVNEYDTFHGVRQLARQQSEVEEEYDKLDSVGAKRVPAVLEGYCSFQEVRSLSVEEHPLEETDYYNVVLDESGNEKVKDFHKGRKSVDYGLNSSPKGRNTGARKSSLPTGNLNTISPTTDAAAKRRVFKRDNKVNTVNSANASGSENVQGGVRNNHAGKAERDSSVRVFDKGDTLHEEDIYDVCTPDDDNNNETQEVIDPIKKVLPKYKERPTRVTGNQVLSDGKTVWNGESCGEKTPDDSVDNRDSAETPVYEDVTESDAEREHMVKDDEENLYDCFDNDEDSSTGVVANGNTAIVAANDQSGSPDIKGATIEIQSKSANSGTNGTNKTISTKGRSDTNNENTKLDIPKSSPNTGKRKDTEKKSNAKGHTNASGDANSKKDSAKPKDSDEYKTKTTKEQPKTNDHVKPKKQDKLTNTSAQAKLKKTSARRKDDYEVFKFQS